MRTSSLPQARRSSVDRANLPPELNAYMKGKVPKGEVCSLHPNHIPCGCENDICIARLPCIRLTEDRMSVTSKRPELMLYLFCVSRSPAHTWNCCNLWGSSGVPARRGNASCSLSSCRDWLRWRICRPRLSRSFCRSSAQAAKGILPNPAHIKQQARTSRSHKCSQFWCADKQRGIMTDIQHHTQSTHTLHLFRVCC